MDYCVEREKRKSEELRIAFRQCFPLADEDDLPWAPQYVKGFLRDRIAREVAEGTFHFTSRIVRVLCEVTPPKTWAVDMARMVVDEVKSLRLECERLKRKLADAEKTRENAP